MKLPSWFYADHLAKYYSGREALLKNEDLKPVEYERRLWGPWNFVAFWLADSININTWMIISSMVVGGLAWWEAWVCVWIGFTIVAIFICLSGRIGATYHIPFPVASRSSFGLFGSLWPILNRGSLRGWAWMSGIMSCVSSFSTLMVNNPDFTRFATRPSAAFWPQLLTIPIGFAVTCFFGVIVGSSSNVIFGQPIWSPLDLLSKLLDSQPSSGTRAGVFFISLAFALAQLGVNIAANSISAGSDLTALLPNSLS
ncbi:unnamed protein product [Rotaria sordida]|uniref:Uracil permease n=1 Tax=Rotaria sordida TaxID=392033 RepID=A0A819EVD8_9BILA|nr:unnamed protein product [Rotaria sordida]